MNVAQLKLSGAALCRRRGERFHVRMNVAQLKHNPFSQFCHTLNSFPRSNERGSIEAHRRFEPVKPDDEFPRSNERGSIEAQPGIACSGVGSYTFPRSNERGSIEAPRIYPRSSQGARFPRSNERGSIEADASGNEQSRARMFPRSNERGSIEAPLVCRAPPQSLAFPRSNERGSIEAPCATDSSPSSRGRFHVRMNVAQLKLQPHCLRLE